MDTRIEKFTKVFFWTGYVVFLSASIPHIAAYFRHFDPVTPNRWEDVSYWIIATAIAIVIDVSDVLVSIAVMRAKASGARRRDTFGFWVFIVFITALSWLINWQYNVVFGTQQFHAVDQYSFFGKVTIGQINPVLGSAFQVLLLVYTAMAHKFAQRPKTAAELQAEADRLEALEEAQKRIDSYHDRNRKKSIIQMAKETVIEAKEAVKEVLTDEPNEEVIAQDEISPEEQTIIEPITDEIPVSEEQDNEEQTPEMEAPKPEYNEVDNELLQVLESYPKVAIEWLAKDRKSATMDEIIEVTGHSKRRLNRVAFARSTRNRDLILISSVIEWLKTVPLPANKAEQNAELPAIKPEQNTDPLPVQNGHRKDTRPLSLDGLVELKV